MGTAAGTMSCFGHKATVVGRVVVVGYAGKKWQGVGGWNGWGWMEGGMVVCLGTHYAQECQQGRSEPMSLSQPALLEGGGRHCRQRIYHELQVGTSAK